FLIGLVLLFGFALFYHIPISIALLALPVLLAIQMVLMVGITLLLSALNVFYRDIGTMLPLFTTLWMFLTPIVYPPEAFPKHYGWVLALNPMWPIVRSYRDVVLNGQLPALGGLAFVAAFSLACFVGSYLLFKHYEPVFVEVA